MAKNLGNKIALMRFIPIAVLIGTAFGLEFGLGMPRIQAVIIALVAALALRLMLVKVIK